MEMRAIISQLAILFFLLALGYAGFKIKALTAEAGKVLTKVVFSITLPATILGSAIGGDLDISGTETAIFMLLVVLVYIIYIAIALPVARILGKGKPLRGLFAFMLIYSNVGFMGLPVTAAIFGPEAVFFNALFNMPNWITAFSFGTVLISGKMDRFSPKTLLNPVIIASFLMIPIALSGFRAPDVIVEAVSLTGNITVPASMFVIGITLAQEPIKGVFTNWRLYPLAFVKLIIIPVVIWLVFRPFVQSELTLGLLVVLSAMPTAAMSAMFAIEYDNNANLASNGVFLTTLLSGITIPLIMFFLLV